MDQQNPNQLPQTSKLRQHKPLYFVLAIIAILAVGGLTYAAIEHFKADEEIMAVSNPLPGNGDDDVKDWEVYRNEEYGFEFKYPEGWQNNEQGNRIEIRNNDGLFLVIIREKENKNRLVIEKWFQELNASADPSPNYWNKIVFNGREAVSAEFPAPDGGFWKSIFIENGEDVIDIERSFQVQDEKIYDKILSTFKFISSTDSISSLQASSGQVSTSTITWNSENEAEFSGYYTQNKREWSTGVVTCDAFVVTNSNYLISYYKDLVLKGNSVNTIDSNGNLIINLELARINEEDVINIKNSTVSNQVSLQVKKKTELGKGAPTCFSFVNILDVN